MFVKIHQMILSHNSKDSLFKMDHNKFSDMTREEKQHYMGLGTQAVTAPDPLQSFVIGNPSLTSEEAIPAELDYRGDECLTPVRDQDLCGSCWAFTALTPLEFSYCKKTGQQITLSEQHLVDCDFLNAGCSGGWYTRAWVYLYLTGGAVNASEYPYTGEEGICKSNQTTVAVQVERIGKAGKDATAIQHSLYTKGPISVAIKATDSLLHFKNGIFDDQESCNNGTLNHAVVLVGYGTANDTDYWIIRNSWGDGWAENGYARIKRGTNLCMTETYAYYATAADNLLQLKKNEDESVSNSAVYP